MLIEQINKFELRGLGPPGRRCSPKPPIFMTKQKSLKIFEWIIFAAKILQEAMFLTSSYLGQITYKIQFQNARF